MIEPDVDLVLEIRGSGNAGQRAAGVNIVLPIVDLLIGSEGEVISFLASVNLETVGLDVDTLDSRDLA
jgi:hypothetical protein